jgi:hypothetical protein
MLKIKQTNIAKKEKMKQRKRKRGVSNNTLPFIDNLTTHVAN